MKGKLITFEGIDGSGKSTQIKNTYNHLSKKGLKVYNYREPGGTELGEKVRDMLLDPKMEIVSKAELELFLSSRAQLLEQIVYPNLEEGNIVLLDRFYGSTLAYQAFGRAKGDPKWIKHINNSMDFLLEDFRPHAQFYLRIPLEESFKRRDARAEKKDRMEQNEKDFFKRVYEGYENFRETGDNVVAIDGMPKQEEVFNSIRVYLDFLLKDYV
ncbi:MAG: dTMP kinase [Candidatus Woesearchaeota archaeon]